MEDESVSITFDNAVADHLAADRLYYKSTTLATIDKAVALLLLAVGLFGTWVAGAWWLVFLPLAALEWFNLLSVRPLMIRWWFKHNPKFRETYDLTFDRSGILFRTRSIESRLTWEHYTKVLENERLWLLVYGTRMYTVIPKRVFESEGHLARFRSLIAQSLVARKQQDG